MADTEQKSVEKPKTQSESAIQQLISMKPTPADYTGLETAAQKLYRSEEEKAIAKEKAESKASKKMYSELEKEGLTSKDLKKRREEAMVRIGEEPKLEPMKDNIKDFASIFSIFSALTFASGGKGRGAGMAGLSALNGAIEGWNKGRKDLFDRNIKEFEKQLASYKARQEKELKLLDLIYQERGAATEDGRALIQEFIAEDQGYAAARLKVGDLKGTYEAKKMQVQGAQKATDQINGMIGRALTSSLRGAAGQANTRYAFNMAESFNQAAKDLENLSRAPAGTLVSSFQALSGKEGESLIQGLSAQFARGITSDDQRLLAQSIEAFDNHLARTLGGGYATSAAKAQLEAYKRQVAREGDNPVAMAMFLARIKQELNLFLEMFSEHPGANEGYLRKMQARMDIINRAIPFDVEDVFAAQRGSRKTISQETSNLVRKPFDYRIPEDQSRGVGVGVLTPRDQEALNWANANPNDPRAQQIKNRLGVR